MGERILREEGFEVVSVTDGETAMLRLKDVDPDLVLVDQALPGVSGYEICTFVKANLPRARVVLSVGALDLLDEAAASKAGADGTLKKPFEASALLALAGRPVKTSSASPKSSARPGRGVVVLDPEQVRAAVTVALDASLPGLVDQITEKVLVSLGVSRVP
jgi:DNA-binding response OmpR family regulator